MFEVFAQAPPDFAIFNVSVCADVRYDVILEEDVSESTRTKQKDPERNVSYLTRRRAGEGPATGPSL